MLRSGNTAMYLNVNHACVHFVLVTTTVQFYNLSIAIKLTDEHVYVCISLSEQLIT